MSRKQLPWTGVFAVTFCLSGAMVFPACLEVRDDYDADSDDTSSADEDEGCLECHHNAEVDPETCGECHGAQGDGPSHTVHLEGGPLGITVPCEDCHDVPTTMYDDGHLNATVEVYFRSELATVGGLEPFFDGRDCNDVYCHGATLTGGTFVPPSWNQEFPEGLSCDACHGNPPPTHQAGWTGCPGCHGAAYDDNDNIDPAVHLDGDVDMD